MNVSHASRHLKAAIPCHLRSRLTRTRDRFLSPMHGHLDSHTGTETCRRHFCRYRTSRRHDKDGGLICCRVVVIGVNGAGIKSKSDPISLLVTHVLFVMLNADWRRQVLPSWPLVDNATCMYGVCTRYVQYCTVWMICELSIGKASRAILQAVCCR